MITKQAAVPDQFFIDITKRLNPLSVQLIPYKK